MIQEIKAIEADWDSKYAQDQINELMKSWGLTCKVSEHSDGVTRHGKCWLFKFYLEGKKRSFIQVYGLPRAKEIALAYIAGWNSAIQRTRMVNDDEKS